MGTLGRSYQSAGPARPACRRRQPHRWLLRGEIRGQVQELEPGTYPIAVNRTSSYLAEGDKAIATAVDKAGAHCHAKGQKFMLRSAVGKTVVFRCVPMHPNRQRRKCLNPFLHRRSNNPEAIHFRSANHVQTAFQVLTECRTGPLNEERSI